jgi:hypothetical protein
MPKGSLDASRKKFFYSRRISFFLRGQSPCKASKFIIPTKIIYLYCFLFINVCDSAYTVMFKIFHLKSSSMSRTLANRLLEVFSFISSSFILLFIMIVFLVIFFLGLFIRSSHGSQCRNTLSTSSLKIKSK